MSWRHCSECRYEYPEFVMVMVRFCEKHEQEEWDRFIEEVTTGWPTFTYIAGASVGTYQSFTVGGSVNLRG